MKLETMGRFAALHGSTALFLTAAPVWAAPKAVAEQAVPAASTTVDATNAQVEDIVVTAQRRAERLQDVPVTVTAITAKTLDAVRVVDTSGIQRLTPGIQLTRSGSGGTTFIRGIGNPSGTAGDEGANAYYIDGVYVPNLFGNLFSFNNIERIEVLKGPQGTLFGRNASGGVVQIITKDPTDTPAMDVTVGYGNYDTVRTAAFVAGPITSTLRASLAATYSHQGEGWGRNVFTGQDVFLDQNYGLQGKIVWEPGADTKLTLSGDYGYSDNDIGPRLSILPGAVPATQPSAVSSGFYSANSNAESFGTRRTYGGSATLVQNLGFADLTAIGAYHDTQIHFANDPDGTPVDFVHTDVHSRDRTWTGEVRLASRSSSPINWLVGAYYLHDNVNLAPGRTFGLAVAPAQYTDINDRQITDSYSAFAQVTVPIFERTRITGGLRYSIDDRGFEGGTNAVLANGAVIAAVPFRTDHVRYSSWTWRAGVDHDFTPDIMGYVSYARGFKSGLFNMNAPQDPPVKPQTVDTAEVGLKSELFDRRLQVNVSAFYNWFDDIQLRSSVQAPVSQLLNAAKATSKGIDVSINAAPTSRLRLFGGFEVLDAKYDKFDVLFPFTYPRPAVCDPAKAGTTAPGASTGAPPTGGNLSCFGKPNGFDMIQSPPFTANAGMTYTLPVSIGHILFSANYSYNDGFFWEADNRLKQNSYSLVDGSIAWRSRDEHLTVTFWVKNIGDTHYYYQEVSSALGDFGAPAAPRTYGIDLRFKFGG